MESERVGEPGVYEGLDRYPLLDALRSRRSRRFGMGMKIESGPFAYESQHEPLPLTETEEAALAFAACGVTGYALADLSYGRGQGGGMLAGLLGRAVASPDAINTVSVFVTNDEATYLLKRPQDFAPTEIPELIELARRGELVELYRRSRIKISDGRAVPPVEPGYNFNINRWALYAPGSTYFLPVEEMTAVYVNAMLEAFDEEMAIFVVDERANFRPAGISRFAQSKGGHLNDDTSSGRMATIQTIEASLAEACAIEQGMVLQNLALMSQALGLGGYPNFARHEFGWFPGAGVQDGRDAGKPVPRREPAHLHGAASAGPRPAGAIPARPGARRRDPPRTLLPAVLPFHGGCRTRVRRTQVRSAGHFPGWGERERLAGAG